MTAAALNPYEPERGREGFLWASAAVVVVAAHLAISVAYVMSRPVPGDRAEAPVIEVEFTPSPPEPVPTTVAPPAEMTATQPPDEPKAEPPPPPQPEPPPQMEAMTPAPPQAEPPPPAAETVTHPEPPPPPRPELTATAVELPPPPSAKPAAIERPKEKPAVAPPAPPKPRITHAEKTTRPPKAAAPPRAQPMRVATAPNPGASVGASAAQASWRGELIARLVRYKRYPSEAQAKHETGTVQLSFTVDRNGHVVSHHIAGSSGSTALDHEVLSMIERAQPLPAFPPSMPQARVSLVVPIHFSIPR